MKHCPTGLKLCAALLPLVVAGGCQKKVSVAAPPRSTAPAEIPKLTSTIQAPISVRNSDIEAALNRAAPKVLWKIDQHEDRCVPSQRVLKNKKVLGVKLSGEKGIKVTPDLGCQIVGNAVRGPIRVTGGGKTLAMTMPVSAVVSVRDVGGIIKSETATGAVNVKADIRLAMRPDWSPSATIKISYNWTNPPGIDVLGKRITFMKEADKKLSAVVADLERKLPAELGKLDLRHELGDIWKSGFTTILLNRENPQAWMRLTPQRLGVVGFRTDKTQATIIAAAQLTTETFIGDRPPNPTPTSLPPASTNLSPTGFMLNTPVLADYAELEPVVLKALRKRAAKGINLKDVGAIDATFDKVTIYATGNNRVAVGVDLTAQIAGRPRTKARASVWLTGSLYNEMDSRVLRVRDLAVAGDTSNEGVNLAIKLFTDPSMVSTIEGALVEDFTKDYNKVVAAAQKAVKEKQLGDIVISANIDKVASGKIQATAQGLYLPVTATGSAQILYRPRK